MDIWDEDADTAPKPEGEPNLTATGRRLDWWGGLLGRPRFEGEPDAYYRTRLMDAMRSNTF